MKGGSTASGYTFAEVTIFLAVSAVLLVSALLLVGGQHGRAQFYQAVINIQSEIEDIINDNNTGYYPKSADFTCLADDSGGPPQIQASARGKGANHGCIYLGRVVHFGPNGNLEQFKSYVVLGRQFTGRINSAVVKSYVEAKPIALFNCPSCSPPVNGVPASAATSDELESGLRIASMKYDSDDADSDVDTDASTVGFLSRLEQYSYNTASVSTQLVAFRGSLSDAEIAVSQQIASLGTAPPVPAPYAIDTKVEICFESGTTEQHVILTIGDNNGRLSTDLNYVDGIAC